MSSVHIGGLAAAAAGGGMSSRGVCRLPCFGTRRMFVYMLVLVTVPFRSGQREWPGSLVTGDQGHNGCE